jgi:hypothetical protein
MERFSCRRDKTIWRLRHREHQVAYRNFFTLWKDADPDIPILKEAKAEYAKLQW